MITKMIKEGWFNPRLDIDLELEDIDIEKLKVERSLFVRKKESGRLYRIEILGEKHPSEIVLEDILITEHPGA